MFPSQLWGDKPLVSLVDELYNGITQLALLYLFKKGRLFQR